MIGVLKLKIVYLGWGSLIWNPSNLKTKGEWYTDGPLLPVEFARISRDGRLTLVLYPGTKKLPVLWIYSEIDNLNDTIKDFKAREGTVESWIGYFSIRENKYNCNIVPNILEDIRSWAIDKNVDSVIWTDLPSNFEEKTAEKLNADNVIKYLVNLPDNEKQIARKYIEKAPIQIMTPIRKEIINILG